MTNLSPDTIEAMERLRTAPATSDQFRGGVQPRTEGPTRRQLMMLADDMGMASTGDAVEYACAVLARWGRPAPQPQPVPVSERPWEREGWCDGQGRCWLLLHSDDGFHVPGWRLDKPSHYDLPDRAVSLPAHALPLPGEVE